jgi:hypothetical protein
MKHLLNGVAIAAVLAIAAPVWAQAPASPSSPPKAPPAAAAPAAGAKMAPMAGAPMAPMAGKQRHKRMHRYMARRGMHRGMGGGGGDMMTDQLNRDELARIQGGGMPMAAPPGGGAGQGGPRPSGR